MPDASALAAVLAAHDVFSVLPADGVRALAARGHLADYVPDELIFQQGDAGGYCLVLLSGQVRVHVTEPGGKDMLIVTMGPGDLLGEMALLDGGPRSASASAMGPVQAIRIAGADFHTALCAYPDAMMALVRLLCGRLRATDEQLTMIALQDLPARLAHYLLRRAARMGQKTAAGPVVPLGLKQSDLADHLASSRESVNKLLHAWQARGLVSLLSSRAVLVQDINGLRAIADPSFLTDPAKEI